MNQSTQRYRVFAEWGGGRCGVSKTIEAAGLVEAIEVVQKQYPDALVSAVPSEEWARQHAELALKRAAARETVHPYPVGDPLNEAALAAARAFGAGLPEVADPA